MLRPPEMVGLSPLASVTIMDVSGWHRVPLSCNNAQQCSTCMNAQGIGGKFLKHGLANGIYYDHSQVTVRTYCTCE